MTTATTPKPSPVQRYSAPDGTMGVIPDCVTVGEVAAWLAKQGLQPTGQAIFTTGSVCFITRRIH